MLNMGEKRGLQLGRTMLWGCVFTVLNLGTCGAMAGGPPTFTQQPVDLNACPGQTVLLSSMAAGEPAPDYQWRVNDVPISGGNYHSMEVFCASLLHSGYVYSVVASNVYGAVTSAPATLHVRVPDEDQAPHTWGVNPTVWKDQVAAWHFRGQTNRVVWVDLVDTSSGGVWGTDIYTDDSSISAAAYHAGILPKGARGTVRLIILGAQSSFQGSDRYGVSSSGYGHWLGSFAFLGTAPTITRHPVSTARMVGGKLDLNVEAFGTGKLTYQWKHNGAFLPWATNSVLTLTITDRAQSGSYAVLVTDENGSTLSQHAMLAVVPARSDHVQTTFLDTATLSVSDFRHVIITGNTNGVRSVWGNGFYTFDSDLGGAVVHAGLAQPGELVCATLVRLPRQPAFLASEGPLISTRAFGAYECFAFAGTGPVVTKDPISQAIPPGETRRLEVSGTYPGGFSIQWRRNGQPVPGGTRSTFQTSVSAPGAVDVYDAVLSSSGNYVPSLAAYVYTLPTNCTPYSASSESEASGFLGLPNFLITAPVKGASNGGTLYGTGIYTCDSTPSVAAVHAGRLAAGASGQVAMYTIGNWPVFISRERDGVLSGSFTTRMPSYVFVMPKSLPASPILTMKAPGTLQIDGDNGTTCQIWATTSLTQPQWVPVGSFALTNSPQIWLDPSASVGARFYKACLNP